MAVERKWLQGALLLLLVSRACSRSLPLSLSRAHVPCLSSPLAPVLFFSFTSTLFSLSLSLSLSIFLSLNFRRAGPLAD